MARTWYLAAVSWLSSTLSLTMVSSGRSLAISSSTGATTRHGPHQGAQKSTRTGASDSMTSAWKFASLTSWRVPAMLAPCWGPFTIQSEARTPVGAVRLVLPGEEGDQQVRRDVGLDDRGEHDDGEGDGRRHERGGEHLVPAALAAEQDPRRQRQEHRGQLGERVRQHGEQQETGADPDLRGDRRRAVREHERLGDEREEGRGADERDREHPGPVVQRADPAAVARGLRRHLAAGDVAGEARQRV